MTDDLIDRLAADLRPVHRLALQRRLGGALLLGLALSAMAMLAWLGLRADLSTAPGSIVFWVKSAYTMALGLLGLVALLTLSRPDGRITWPWLAAPGLLVALLAAAVAQLTRASPDQVMPLVVGGSNLVCPWYIIALSLPLLGASLLVLRRLAPARPTLAGLAAGLMSGGIGAWVYSFHCGENGMMFLALWYTLGIAVVAALGAMLGRLMLRW